MTFQIWPSHIVQLAVVFGLLIFADTLGRSGHSEGGIDEETGYMDPRFDSMDRPPGVEIEAFVNNAPIYDVDVERAAAKAFGAASKGDLDLPFGLKSSVLNRLIDRELALQYIESTDFRPSSSEVNREISRVKKELEARGKSLDAYLTENHTDMRMLRRRIAWNIAWPRYADASLTDDNLRRYFELHRRDFDGTQRKLSQILLTTNETEPSQVVERQRDIAARLRVQIKRGEFAFEKAARSYSNAPSSEQGGLVGWIGRHNQLPEEIHNAAFDAPLGEVAGPIQTSFGIHLICVTEEQLGEIPWEEVKHEVREAAERYLFSYTADRGRSQADVKYRNSYEYPEEYRDYMSPYPEPRHMGPSPTMSHGGGI
ncbi:peptidylprolyl isomerase [Blastopirellula marina]|uniref:peptidylprolyl isomerase n=1 Tax=Blastopirellula marina DSM 3645 TaxID=314230 RepID=A3ZML8_9BACT|nr:peptidylprolyl isomerase [Blastopirellula marina]EAQ82191.1 PpiC-type peptidyl-prolyl cis-trans isomerase [Blastopirellula marina DSM 3645]